MCCRHVLSPLHLIELACCYYPIPYVMVDVATMLFTSVPPDPYSPFLRNSWKPSRMGVRVRVRVHGNTLPYPIAYKRFRISLQLCLPQPTLPLRHLLVLLPLLV